MTVLIEPDELEGKCCANCAHAKIVPFTEGAVWQGDKQCPNRRHGRVATKTGRVSGSLRTVRGCREFRGMAPREREAVAV